LPQGFSEACAADCENRHRHLSLREIKELESAGEIEFFDVHPERKTARYIVRVHSTQKVHIPSSMMEAAAGAYRRHRGEMKRARLLVSAYAKENSEFGRLIADVRWVTLARLFWNKEGLVGDFDCDDSMALGTPVRVAFVPIRFISPETRAVAADYWSLLRRDSETPFLRVETDRLVFRSMEKFEIQRRRRALKQLDSVWSEIVAEFSAGPFSQVLNETPASELPSTVLEKTLREFLR
jgi:hypothetical protein